MPNLAKILKDEISRLARKEAKAVAQPIALQVRDLKKTATQQKRQIAQLQKKLGKKPDQTATGSIQVGSKIPERSIRISPASIRKHRQRLGLSQREIGLLLDVSTLTVCKWESGNTTPRGRNRKTIAELRKMGIREIRDRLGKI
ncbi:MAG: helix-turn-helix domain-containing protein [bacterium]|nr:helix-turn-helix domain-containing protein [bacterium]